MSVRKIYLMPNGLTAVFDQHGRQVPEYQGKQEEMIPKLLEDALSADWYRTGSFGSNLLLTQADKEELKTSPTKYSRK